MVRNPCIWRFYFFQSCTQNNIFESRQKNWPHHNWRICTHCMQSLKFRWGWQINLNFFHGVAFLFLKIDSALPLIFRFFENTGERRQDTFSEETFFFKSQDWKVFINWTHPKQEENILRRKICPKNVFVFTFEPRKYRLLYHNNNNNKFRWAKLQFDQSLASLV